MVEPYIERDATDTFSGIVWPTYTFYMVAELEVRSRCSCNGHATSCHDQAGANGRAVCACEHGATGPNCEACAPLHNAKPWARGVSTATPNVCVPCECNAHADSCHYDGAQDPMRGLRVGTDGGICDRCQVQ